MDKIKGDYIKIRNAERQDCGDIIELKKELALHQSLTGKMLSAEDLQRDGFDTHPPLFHCVVAEDFDPELLESGRCSRVVGYGLYYFAYSGWEGRVLHLEDLCVSKSGRGKGIGSKMMKELARIALEERCTRMQLEVLENNNARKFYDNHGGINVTEQEHWHNYRVYKSVIDKLCESS